MLRSRSRKVFRPSTEVLDSRELMSALTVEVTNTLEAGPGSLRRAIKLSNLHPTDAAAPNVINFAIPGTGVQQIRITKALPQITAPVLIDGYTQAGSSRNTNPITSATSNNAVLTVQLMAPHLQILPRGSGTTIRGLSFMIDDRNLVGIELDHATNVSITGNVFSSTVRSKNLNDYALNVFACSNSTVGGSTRFPALQNVMIGFGTAVRFGGNASHNGAIGNIIAQRQPPRAESIGVILAPSTSHNDIGFNLIAGTTKPITDYGTGNAIANNTVVK